jgi:hypothetical protein
MIAEQALVNGLDAISYVGDTNGEFTVDLEMAQDLQAYLDILRLHEMLADDSVVEHRVEFNNDCWGTVDYAMATADTLHVFDLKFGRTLVDATANRQLMVYAAALLADPPEDAPAFSRKFNRVKFHIVQPRVNARSDDESCVRGRHQAWTMRMDEFEAWVEQELTVRIKAALEPQARLQPGDHCTFCPAKPHCPALREHALQSAQEVFPSGDLDSPTQPPAPVTLDPERMRAVLDAAPLVRKWLDAVEQHAASEAKAGRVVDGYKLVATIGNRRWNDEVEAQNALRDAGVDPTVTSMISPAQAQKALGGTKHKPVIDGLCNRPVTGEKLVPVSDRRPALPGADVFSEASN